jgi:hypothetical protein
MPANATELEKRLWGAADEPRPNSPNSKLKSSEYSVPVLDLIFLRYPALFTSIWLWLYAGSGFLLKAARRFDIGFEWFNRHFDIEKKPLQSIGLVAGALVYWAVVIVSRVVG